MFGGTTGAGKSVLLALLALQFRRYAGSQVTIFDKGNSARAAVLAMGGEHHGLGSDGSLAFQPLRGIDASASAGGRMLRRSLLAICWISLAIRPAGRNLAQG